MTVVKIPENVPGTGPVQMLNLLKFADRQMYVNEYLPAFTRVMEMLGMEARIKLSNNILGSIIADANEDWDAILIVEYPSAEAFIKSGDEFGISPTC